MVCKDEFMLFSYHATCDDWFGVDGVRSYLERSNLTIDALRLYKEAGFNVLFVSYVFGYNALEEEWEQTKTKRVMDMAHELDMKCIVFEWNLHRLTGTSHSLIDAAQADGYGTFSSEQELENFVRNCLKGPMSHPAFFGVSVRDEPFYPMFKAQGEVYRAIKKIAPQAYVNMNILPYSPNFVLREHRGFYAVDEEEIGPFAAYQKYNETFYREVNPERLQYDDYIELFYEKVKPERIQYDDYPLFIDANGNTSIRTWHLHNAQIVADFCKEKGIEFHKVFQTCAYDTRVPVCRKPDATDMYWQMNVGMAMGIKGYTYWSYYPILNTAGEYYDETATFVKYDGSKNSTYYTMQQLHSEMQTTATALANFEYEGMAYYVKTPIPGDKAFLAGVKQNDLTYVEQVSLSTEGIVLCSEFTDDDVYGYYLVNATDPTKKVEETVSVSFKGFDCIQIYYNGTVKNEKLEEGKSTFTLAPGEGVFVIPFNS